MPTTTGFVHKLQILTGSASSSSACAEIGPTPNNVELLTVQRSNSDPGHVGAFKNSIVDALSTALVGRHPVAATHGSGSAEITSLRIDGS